MGEVISSGNGDSVLTERGVFLEEEAVLRDYSGNAMESSVVIQVLSGDGGCKRQEPHNPSA